MRDERRIKELRKKIRELDATIDFRYCNMGYFDIESDKIKKRLFNELRELESGKNEMSRM